MIFRSACFLLESPKVNLTEKTNGSVETDPFYPYMSVRSAETSGKTFRFRMK